MPANPAPRPWWRDLSPTAVVAGFVAVLVGFTSSVVIVFQAASALGATPAQATSWMWALGLGMGLTSLGLSLWYRQPVLTAWSTPGAALLVTIAFALWNPLQTAVVVRYADSALGLLVAFLLLVSWPVNRWLAKRFAAS